MSKPREKKKSVAERYIADVLAGKILTSKLVRKQIERHVRDLALGHERGLYFDPKKPVRVIRSFADFLCHTEGQWDGQPFVLTPYQQAKVWILYGWKKAGTNYRRFKFAYNEEGRGIGKSAFASGCASMSWSDEVRRARRFIAPRPIRRPRSWCGTPPP